MDDDDDDGGDDDGDDYDDDDDDDEKLSSLTDFFDVNVLPQPSQSPSRHCNH